MSPLSKDARGLAGGSSDTFGWSDTSPAVALRQRDATLGSARCLATEVARQSSKKQPNWPHSENGILRFSGADSGEFGCFTPNRFGEFTMRQSFESVKRFLLSDDGPTAVEYAVMMALIIVVCITTITAIGNNANTKFGQVKDALT